VIDFFIPVADWINVAFEAISFHISPTLRAFSAFLEVIIRGFEDILLWPPEIVILALVGILIWRIAGKKLAVFAVIGPHGQSQYFVRALRLRRQNDDGDVFLGPDLHGSRQPVQPGHHHIQDDKMDLLSADYIESLQSVVGRQYFIALILQIDGNCFYYLPVIVNHQNALL
jgi:hypothetical protein